MSQRGRGRGRILEQEGGRAALARARAGVRGRGARVGRSQMTESDTRSQIQQMRAEVEQLTRSVSSSTNNVIQPTSNWTPSFLMSSTIQSNFSSQPETSSSSLFSPVATAKETAAVAKATGVAAKATAAAAEVGVAAQAEAEVAPAEQRVVAEPVVPLGAHVLATEEPDLQQAMQDAPIWA